MTRTSETGMVPDIGRTDQVDVAIVGASTAGLRRCARFTLVMDPDPPWCRRRCRTGLARQNQLYT
jgi:hypothetical protein